MNWEEVTQDLEPGPAVRTVLALVLEPKVCFFGWTCLHLLLASLPWT